jgi:hypothetical protein
MTTYNESLSAAITALQTLVAAVTGIKAAPASPPDAPSGQWPLSIAFPSAGRFEGGGNVQLAGYHTIVVQIHYTRADLARAYATIAPYLETVVAAIAASPTLSSTVTAIAGPVLYSFGAMTFASVDTIGWQFDVPVKIRYTEKET